MLQSGCREGIELRGVWSDMCAEAVEAAGWLGEEVSEVFLVREEGVGCGSVTGETRGKLVEAREKTRAKLLIQALEQFRPQKARPVWFLRQRDKLSTAWLLALPLPHTALTRLWSLREFGSERGEPMPSASRMVSPF